MDSYDAAGACQFASRESKKACQLVGFLKIF